MPLLDIRDVARYIGLSLTTKGLSVSPLKLQKILYYVQAWHMVFLGRDATLFADVPQAWVNGPVYPVIYHIYKPMAANMCDHLDASAFSRDGVDPTHALTPDRIELIESIIMLYGARSQNQLILLTHTERPWAETRGDLPPFARSEKEIPLDLIYSYYKQRHDRPAARAGTAPAKEPCPPVTSNQL